MRVLGLGIDLVETARIERVWSQHRDRFLARILTPAERAYCERHKNPVPRIAGRFAAKEAILKVLGTGWRGEIAWTDMEILNDRSGQPAVTLSGHSAKVAQQLGITQVLISITHTDCHAAANAVGLGDSGAPA